LEYERIEYTPYGESWIEKAADGVEMLPFRFTGKELDAETGLYYYGARYLNPKTSVWISADPALGEYLPVAPVDDEAKKHNGNLPGQGGVFNLVNLAVYHYAANNPVKYTDPDGKETNIVMLFDKSSQTMSVTIYNGDAHPIQFTYAASSVPSTSRSPDYPRTMDSNEAYYPTSFPNGTYNICGADVVHPDNDAYGHTEIKVEATQEVPTYVKGKDGWQATGRTTTDRHYQIHGGGYTGSPQGKNNYLDKTFGCIRMKKADIDKRGEMIKKASDSGGTITLTVQE
jgi:RHS repeat-associated protein